MTAGKGKNNHMKQTGRTRSSVFIRYALSYTAVVLTLFFFIAGYLYLRASGHARQTLIDSQVNRLTRIANQHENTISAMLNTAEQIGLSPHIEAFSYDLEPWKAYDLQLQLVPYTSTTQSSPKSRSPSRGTLRFSGTPSSEPFLPS